MYVRGVLTQLEIRAQQHHIHATQIVRFALGRHSKYRTVRYIVLN